MTEIKFVPDENKREYEYAVSACLCGVPCRYDGKSKCVDEIKALYDSKKAIMICPEVMGGMTTPRDPSEIIGAGVFSCNGADNTAYFKSGAEKALEMCRTYGVKTAILKQNSPSCGSRQIYDGSFSGKLIDGMGITAKLFSENGIDVVGEK